MDEKNNEIQVFESPEFGEVRTMLDEKGDVLFCASDVAKALGYTNPNKAILDHCKGVTKRDTITKTRGKQKLSYIYEPDVYRLIMKSKLPAAEKFESWLFTNVLPSIRKHGAYMTSGKVTELLQNPDNLVSLLSALIEEKNKTSEMQEELTALKPKAAYFDKVVDSSLLINFRTAAKEFQMKPTLFIKVMLAKKYLYRDAKGDLFPYQQYVESGLFEIKEFCRNNYCGTYPLLTPKGRDHFLKLIQTFTKEDLWDIQLTIA